MTFRTPIITTPYSTPISYQDNILLLGSCFSNTVGDLLINNKFSARVNPFGTLYNPISIAQLLQRCMTNRVFNKEEFIYHQELHHNPYLHGQFSCSTLQEAITKSNRSLLETQIYLEQSRYLIVTWGTAWVYQSKSSKQVVSNCHKLPSREFNRYKVGVNDIVEIWSSVLAELKLKYPKLHILFTVSPIRHRADGDHENQLSKATLLLAQDQLITQHPQCSYFPSYEIMMDDLRDYRFYETDMIHPSPLAINYIFECFCTHWISASSQQLMKQIQKIKQALAHKPFNPHLNEYRNFLQKQKTAIEALVSQYPFLNFNKELDDINHDK